MAGAETDWPTYLAIRAAWMSFVGGSTQSEIASHLGISSAKVHRLIAQAQRDGLIRFQIEGRPIECLQYEDQLQATFGLKTCLVVPRVRPAGQSEAHVIDAIASAAGPFLGNLLSQPHIGSVGVGMGRTLKAAFSALPRQRRDDLSVMAVSGSLTPKLAANPYDVIQLLQERTGAEGYFLPVPYFASSRQERDTFLNQPSVQDLMARARQADLFVIGIGSIDDKSHLMTTGMISTEEQCRLEKAGAVCDLMGRFLNDQGSQVQTELERHPVGLHFNDIRGARVVALAGGLNKLAATRAALLSGVISDIVLDEALAAELVASGAGAARSTSKLSTQYSEA
ncbi:sugar-binding transcriptional regulator [Coralliovum pocilloporae]|uniref:sugar-binding transcriptional regulator n=1 Tax=Coralliovum pocilloporae TaxID=3066369 RepID=UPI003306C356